MTQQPNMINTEQPMIDNCQAFPYIADMRKRVSEVLRQAVLRAPSRYAVAKATGIEQSALSRFVRGKRSLSLESVDAIAQHLGLELRQTKHPKAGGQ